MVIDIEQVGACSSLRQSDECKRDESTVGVILDAADPTGNQFGDGQLYLIDHALKLNILLTSTVEDETVGQPMVLYKLKERINASPQAFVWWFHGRGRGRNRGGEPISDLLEKRKVETSFRVEVAIDDWFGYRRTGGDFVHGGGIETVNGKLLDGRRDDDLAAIGCREP